MNIKHQAIFNVIKQYKGDSLISTSPTNRKWLLNDAVMDFCLILAVNNKIHVFVDERDIASLKKFNPEIVPHLYKDVNSWLDFCKKQKLQSTLFESNSISYDQYMAYVKPLKTKLIPINGDDLRIAKSKEELLKLQKSADIICQAIEHLKK
jgi:Xaa-Pro aminopeptidase